jgi:hypothetical protein
LLLDLGVNVHAQDEHGRTPLYDAAAAAGFVKIVKLLLELGANVHTQAKNGSTPLYEVDAGGHEETVKLLWEFGARCTGCMHAQDVAGHKPQYRAESKVHEAVVSSMGKTANGKRTKSKPTSVVDPAAQAAAEAAAAAMAALLIAEEEAQKQAPPSKQGNSNKARKHRNQKKTNPNELKKKKMTQRWVVYGGIRHAEPQREMFSRSYELNTSFKGHDESNSGIVASSSGKRNSVGEKDNTGRDAARHSEPDREMDGRGEENAVRAVFDNSCQGHNEPEGIISRNVQ